METYYTGNENILKKNLKTYKKDMELYKKKQAVVFTDYRFYFQ